MFRWIKNVMYLSGKELHSLFSDPVLVVLIVYMFTAAVYSVANSITLEVKNASVAIVDHDHSALSYRLQQSLIAPNFRKVHTINANEADRLMDTGEYTFILDIPSNYERDVLAGHNPSIQLLSDATAMTQAAIGVSYISQIFREEMNDFLHVRQAHRLLIEPTINVLYNPNFSSSWFMGGMPVRSSEIAIAKILANELVLLTVVAFSLYFVVHKIIGTPLPPGAFSLYLLGAAVFIFTIASLGIMLAIFAPTMPQFGLLVLPVYIVMYMLSGTMSPVDNMPEIVQQLTQLSPTTIFGAYAQDVLFRGAGIDLVWDKLVKIAALGALFLSVALAQFKSMLSRQG